MAKIRHRRALRIHIENRDFEDRQRWGLLMGGMRVEGRGLEDLGDEYSVNGEGRERFRFKLSPIFS